MSVWDIKAFVAEVLWGNVEYFETFGILKLLGGVSAPLQS